MGADTVVRSDGYKLEDWKDEEEDQGVTIGFSSIQFEVPSQDPVEDEGEEHEVAWKG